MSIIPYCLISYNLSQKSYTYLEKKRKKNFNQYCKINPPKRQRPEITYELCTRNILLPILEVYSVRVLSPHLDVLTIAQASLPSQLLMCLWFGYSSHPVT